MSETGLRVEEVVAVDAEFTDAMTRLLPQLSSTAARPSTDELDDLVQSSASVVFVARTDDGIVGSLTLAIFRVPTGVRAWIEDVVVDQSARGQGIGGALIEAAVARASLAGARTVDLTSRPSRTEANRLYQSLGFVLRETNVYRRSLEGDGIAPS